MFIVVWKVGLHRLVLIVFCKNKARGVKI